MGKINSREKGARFERTIANILRENGFDTKRGCQFSQGTYGLTNADVIGIDGLHIECKAVETLNIFKAMENVNLNMVMGYKQNEEYHDFLSIYNEENKSGIFDYKEAFTRQIALIGEDKQNILRNSKVLIFGIGGVGGHAIDALARSGIGNIDIVDKDVVSLSNLNRQIIANLNTIGRNKTEVMKERILSVNPTCKVNVFNEFVVKNTIDMFDYKKYDYVVDCIDTVSAKLDIVEECYKNNVKVISAMGTAKKMDPTRLEITDINKTSVCPLAKVMRYELRKRDVKKLKVVYSKEEPIETILTEDGPMLGSVSFVPSVAGLLIASEVIKDLIKDINNEEDIK